MALQSSPPILIAVLEYGELPELLRIAEVASESLNTQAVFLFTKRSYRRLAQDTAVVIKNGFLWMDADGGLHKRPAFAESLVIPAHERHVKVADAESLIPVEIVNRSFLGRVRAFALFPFIALASLFSQIKQWVHLLARDVANFGRDIRRFRRRYNELRTIVKNLRPKVLIVGQICPGSDLSLLLIAAGRLSIPRLVTPFAMFSLQEFAEFAVAKTSHHSTSSVLNKLVSRVFKHWVLNYNGTTVLRLPGYRALALEITQLIEGMPWSPVSEPIEAITADSEISANTLLSFGVQQSQIHVIGSPVHDSLAKNLAKRSDLRAALCKEYGLPPDKPFVVCGWPVNMFAWLGSRTIAYPDYAALATAWANALAAVRDLYGVNVIVSIHPKTLQEEFLPAEHLGLPCRRNDADELIAACDLFTTLNGSSITAWAIACGIPVLIFDCFHTRYPDFLDVPGCVNVDTEEAFIAELNNLCNNSLLREALADRQREVAVKWGKLDGETSSRLSRLITSLVR